MRRFSGRVMPLSAPMMAVVRVRRSTLRSARPAASASGSGSLCSRISTRSASAKYRWYCCTRARVSDRPSSVVSVGESSSARSRCDNSGTTARSSSMCLRWIGAVDVEHVQQAAAGVADGGDDFLQAATAVALDDDAGVRRDVGAEVGVDPLGIADGRRNPVVDESSSERAALDEELDVESSRQHPMQQSDDQLVLADGQRAHNQ